VPGLHNARFVPDESAFAAGTSMLAHVALKWLGVSLYQ
jgi:hypothetical protein